MNFIFSHLKAFATISANWWCNSSVCFLFCKFEYKVTTRRWNGYYKISPVSTWNNQKECKNVMMTEITLFQKGSINQF